MPCTGELIARQSQASGTRLTSSFITFSWATTDAQLALYSHSRFISCLSQLPGTLLVVVLLLPMQRKLPDDDDDNDNVDDEGFGVATQRNATT